MPRFGNAEYVNCAVSYNLQYVFEFFVQRPYIKAGDTMAKSTLKLELAAAGRWRMTSRVVDKHDGQHGSPGVEQASSLTLYE